MEKIYKELVKKVKETAKELKCEYVNVNNLSFVKTWDFDKHCDGDNEMIFNVESVVADDVKDTIFYDEDLEEVIEKLEILLSKKEVSEEKDYE